MGTRLVPVENVQHMLDCYEAGILLHSMGEYREVENPRVYRLVESHWTAKDLRREYLANTTWQRDEWRIRLED